MVDGTRDDRDRLVDFLRAGAIVVVVLWHWVFSVTQWVDGGLAMPNPIGTVPGVWAATWVLQVMPVFFLVGGFANLTVWRRVQALGGSWPAFAEIRLRRLLRPVVPFAVLWGAADVLGLLLVPGYTSVWQWGSVVMIPLWFLGVYLVVVLLAPVTARLHDLGRRSVLVAALALLAAGELLRIPAGQAWLWPATSALVWLFAHQLGFFWQDGTLTSGDTRLRAWAITAAGFGGLLVLTSLGVYPRSMVAVAGEESNVLPTTPCIAALAVFQLGIVLLAQPAAERWLVRPGPLAFTVGLNAVALTVFTWHMTALVGAIGIYQLAGGELLTEPTSAWWIQRPLWLILPGILLVPLVAIFARFERPYGPV
jgi:hypothetical protein